jgi:hypothetical protein
MSLVRIELQLREDVPAEADLIAMLDSLVSRGGKSDLLRECLLRGLFELSQRADALSAHGNEDYLLDMLAKEFANSGAGYRDIHAYLRARRVLSSSETGHAAGVDTAHGKAQIAQVPLKQVPLDVEPVKTEPAPMPTPVAAPTPDVPVADSEPSFWASLQGLAGSDGDER